MLATDSIRTATRCWCSDRRVITRRVARRVMSIVLVIAAAGCVTRTSTAYVPSPEEPRLSTDEARDQLDQLLRVECPRLMQAGRDTRVARVDLDVDREGHVLRSRIGSSTGDERIDAMFGAIAAKLQLAPPAEMKNDVETGHVRMGYSCSSTAAVATVDLD